VGLQALIPGLAHARALETALRSREKDADFSMVEGLRVPVLAALLAARDYLAVYDSADDIAALTPDFSALAALDRFAVIVTAPGVGGVDFVSRFFAPAQGVNEDPVTGSSHCTLIPYWAQRLGKDRLAARQLSRRGGALSCALVNAPGGDRVTIAGRAVLYLEGTITV